MGHGFIELNKWIFAPLIQNINETKSLPQNLGELKILPDEHCKTQLEFYKLSVAPHTDFTLHRRLLKYLGVSA